MDKALEWAKKLLKGLMPAAHRDPVTASLAVLAILAEIMTLSEWQYWVRSFHIWDAISSLLVLVLLWRQARRSWAEAALPLALGVDSQCIAVTVASGRRRMPSMAYSFTEESGIIWNRLQLQRTLNRS